MEQGWRKRQPWPNRTSEIFHVAACRISTLELPGLEAGTAAQRRRDAFLRFHSRLFRAFFIENKSLIEKETCVEVARQVGLDMNTFLHDIEDTALQDQVRQQCADAMNTYFVSAVPTVLIGGKRRQIGMVPAATYLEDLATLGVL